MELIATIGCILLIVSMSAMSVYIIINTIKSERKRKAFEPDMSVGDAVYFPVANGSLSGEILEVNNDSVKIVVSVTRSRVYPSEQKLNKMKASEAKSISDEVQAQSDISKALDKIRDAANDGQYLAKIYGLTKGQKAALSELGKFKNTYLGNKKKK